MRTHFSYERLADTIGSKLPFIFLNNSCYSGGAILTFAKKGLLPQYGSVIASTQPYQKSYGVVFLDEFTRSLRERKLFRRKKLLTRAYAEQPVQSGMSASSARKIVPVSQSPTRYGINLDYLLYPTQR